MVKHIAIFMAIKNIITSIFKPEILPSMFVNTYCVKLVLTYHLLPVNNMADTLMQCIRVVCKLGMLSSTDDINPKWNDTFFPDGCS